MGCVNLIREMVTEYVFGVVMGFSNGQICSNRIAPRSHDLEVKSLKLFLNELYAIHTNQDSEDKRIGRLRRSMDSKLKPHKLRLGSIVDQLMLHCTVAFLGLLNY